MALMTNIPHFITPFSEKPTHFVKELGISFDEITPGESHLSLKIRDEHLNLSGTVHGGVTFSEENWRVWLDEDLRRRIAEMYDAHVNFQNLYVALKYPRPALDLAHLISSLYRITIDSSAEVYMGCKMELHPNDRGALYGVEPAFDPGNRKFLFQIAERLARRLDLIKKAKKGE